MWPWWAWLLGAIGTIGATVGVGLAVAKAWTVHDWRTCQCVDCRKRRYHKHKEKGHQVLGVKPDGDLIWGEWTPKGPSARDGRMKSTAELEPGMVVVVRGVNHRVTEVRSDVKGYLVMLNPMGGPNRGKSIIASVRWANGNLKYWEVR